MATTTRTVDIPEQLDSVKVLGVYDEVIREIEREYKEITVHVRGNRITITSTSRQGEREASQAQELIRALIDAAYTSPLDAATVRRMLEQQVLHNDVRDEVPGHGPTVQKLRRFKEHERTQARQIESVHRKPSVPGTITYAAGYPVRPKTSGQIAYVNAIESNTITFGIGPAGTGKTYLAVAKAVSDFEEGRVRRIILTVPPSRRGEPRLPAGHAQREGGSISAAAVRRALRHARC